MADEINSILEVSEDDSSSFVSAGRVPPAKVKYIRRIRTESAYPAFRSLVSTFALILYISGTLLILAGLIGGLSLAEREGAGALSVVFGGVIVGVLYIIIGRVSKEAAFMLADVADSITDLNSRYEPQE